MSAPDFFMLNSPSSHSPCPCAGQVFGYTPDETAFARLWLERGAVGDALTMVQPALLSYGLGAPPRPALLDVASIQARRRPLAPRTCLMEE